MRIAYMELWWLGLAPVIAIALFIYASWRRNQISKALGEVHLVELLTESLSLEKRLLKIIMLIIALATLALAGMRRSCGSLLCGESWGNFA